MSFSELKVKGDVPGISAEDFREAVSQASEGCPISQALKGNVQISAEGELADGTARRSGQSGRHGNGYKPHDAYRVSRLRREAGALESFHSSCPIGPITTLQMAGSAGSTMCRVRRRGFAPGTCRNAGRASCRPGRRPAVFHHSRRDCPRRPRSSRRSCLVRRPRRVAHRGRLGAGGEPPQARVFARRSGCIPARKSDSSA